MTDNGTETPKLKLYKPSLGEKAWGEKVNENFDKIDKITYKEIGAEPKIEDKRSAFNCDFGSTAGTVCQGNDQRLQPFSELPAHTATTPKYGGASDTLYGHVKASSLLPQQAGIASPGVQTSIYARGDHIHPLQENVTGSSGTTTKLQTGRNISVTKGMTCDPRIFDGTEDINLDVKYVDASSITGTLPYYTLPTASVTKKGGIIVGDGLLVKNGVISVDPARIRVTDVVSRGSITKTALLAGYKLITVEASKKSFSGSASHVYSAEFNLGENVSLSPSYYSFRRSDTLPTCFSFDGELPGTLQIPSFVIHITSNADGEPQYLGVGLMLYIYCNGGEIYKERFGVGGSRPGGNVYSTITLPARFNPETDRLSLKASMWCEFQPSRKGPVWVNVYIDDQITEMPIYL